MKSKFLAVVVAMSMIFAAVPAFAEETPVSGNGTDMQEATVEENVEVIPAEAAEIKVMSAGVKLKPVGAPALDAKVQATVDAYEQIITILAQPSLTAGDITTIKTPYDNIVSVEFTDAQQKQYEEYVEKTYGDQYFTDMWDCAYLIYLCETACTEYHNQPNVKTAYDLIGAYDEISPERQAKINNVTVAGGGTVSQMYNDAKNNNSPADVINVYEAYSAMEEALDYSEMENLKTAAAEFEELLDAYNNMTDAEFEQLALLMGESNGEEAFDTVLGTCIITNIVLEMDSVYTAYENNPNDPEKIKAFTDYYDSVFNDPEFSDEDLSDIVRGFFPDIDEDYNAALAAVSSDSNAGEKGEDEPETQSEDKISDKIKDERKNNPDASPDTSDEIPAAGLMMMFVLSFGVSLITFRRKKI